ncbi:MAG: NAD(P)-binding protein [Flavobacteriaceae bacterium]|nr:NAD(P)-binding protein [Flavobacteriaceae bacterium]
MDKEARVHIIGAGISGLTAALVLEKNGFSPVIYEASGSAGGRVKTEIFNGYHLDIGFQVLLEAYPKVQKYLDIEALEPIELWPGAMIFNDGHREIIGDPLRNIALLWPTIKAESATFSDKLKVLRLNLELQSTSLNDIFNGEDIPTREYLLQKGFSDSMMTKFFIPFFSGIFLEEQLQTSCRMFKFVYKMFGKGNALIPKDGIGVITDQLVSKLGRTKIKYNRPVYRVKDGTIVFEDGSQQLSDRIIIATADTKLTGRTGERPLRWQTSDTLYFESLKDEIRKPLIGLIADPEALINSIIYLPQESAVSKKPYILSVTVVKSHQLSPVDLQKQVEADLSRFCGISDVKFLKHYAIRKGLPVVEDLKNRLPLSAYRLDKNTYLAGDYLLNGSLNAAMASGEGAAHALIEDCNLTN